MVRTFARVFATAALAATAAAIPLSGTAMAAPAHSPVAAHQFRDVDRCTDFGRRHAGHHARDRHRNRWDRDCRYRWDRRPAHRAHWYDAYGRYRTQAWYGWDCGRRI
ncbi:hypothetical protein ACIOWI_08685 [Streptomyces sp. NPDC087659]|uniref:hypothetical protein n=1 Tax=Streptomyces sp. NPDC087659 TaxID=3365801 RepID=UPI0038031AA8